MRLRPGAPSRVGRPGGVPPRWPEPGAPGSKVGRVGGLRLAGGPGRLPGGGLDGDQGAEALDAEGDGGQWAMYIAGWKLGSVDDLPAGG